MAYPPVSMHPPLVTRVLLVDDDATVSRAITRALRSHGVVATPAATVDAAREALTAARFDLIVCDLVLGRESGLTLLDQVRAGGDQTPFVLITGCTAEDRQAAERDLRIAAILLKPFDVAALGRVVRDVVADARRARP